MSNVPAGAGAVVMGTGIMSIALAQDGVAVPSRVLLALAASIWLALAAICCLRLTRDRARLVVEARTPAALTAVAATAVLGARLVGQRTDARWTHRAR